VHGREPGHFARHPDGRVERAEDVTTPAASAAASGA
jgi:hypothetical protein